MTLDRGTILNERYEIEEILGQGGMGSVYRAVDNNLGVDVALKENLFTTDEYARQFRLEAVILANLRHPNLPRVSNHFVVGDQGQYLVMDFIDGEDLRERMERTGTITEDEAIMIGAAMCDALAYLHSRNPTILHRDIKPGNVKITPEGYLYLVDFGLAKVVKGSEATTTGARAMTPGYSPPEQYGTARTDPRTDIYSLGATLYAALTGIIPEDGLARAMDNAKLTPLRKRNNKVSRRLSSTIETAMAIDPAERYQTAGEFQKALLASKSKTQRITGNYTVTPPPIESKKSEDTPSGKKPTEEKMGLLEAEPGYEFKPPKRRRRRRSLLTNFLLILLISIGVVGGVSFFSPASVSRYIPWMVPTEIITPTPMPETTPAPETSSPILVEPTMTQVGGGYGQIAFASTRSGVPQIYLMGSDGGEAQPITEFLDGACQPEWAPDGEKLAFISPCKLDQDTYPESSLYIMNVDGGHLSPVTTAPGGDFDPAWSPDGNRIAFSSLRDGHKEIYTINLQNLKVTRLTNTDDAEGNGQSAWSPAGDQIVFTKQRLGAFQIWLMDDTGENAIQLVRSGQDLRDFYPTWTPNGEVILFSQQQSTERSLPWLMQISYEDRESQLPSRTKLDLVSVQNIDFSPDGFWIAYEGGASLDKKDIFYMTAGGGAQTQLTTDESDDFDPAWRPISVP